ncbi:MAG: MFS transporter [Microgenomates group bacterium]
MFRSTNTRMERNVKLYYLLTISTNLWFGASSWLYVWRRFMSFGQLGWVDGIGFGFSLLLDIPTGALADIFGKRITLILSNICAGIGITIIAFANSLPAIFIGNMILQLGWAMFSGASDAITYDSLLIEKKEHLFAAVLSKANQYMSYAASVGYFFGGLLYTMHWRLPHIMWALSYIPALIFSFLLTEPHVNTNRFSAKEYIKKINLGIKELLLPQLRKYILLIFVLLGIYFLYTWGFVRPAIATYFGFYSKEQSIILPILTLSCAFLIQYLPVVRKRISNFKGLTILALIMAFGFLLSAFPIGYWGIIPMFLIAFAGKFASPWVSIIVNKEISSEYRATTLSTISLLSKIPYVLVAVLIGQAAEKNMLPQFNMGIAGIILFVLIISSVLKLKAKQ